MGIVVVVVADYGINPNVVYTVNGLEYFRMDRFHSGDNRKLKQTAVCFLKYIDTTNRGWYFAGTKCLDSRTIKRRSLETVLRLTVM
jgi:hypothetical protein